MAKGVRYVCDSCGHTIEAWSDGNPYHIDEAGKKRYAYHPDHENLARCIGNDTPHLCLACGREFVVDSNAPRSECPLCEESDIAPTFELGDRPCPHCGEGVFRRDPDYFAIS